MAGRASSDPVTMYAVSLEYYGGTLLCPDLAEVQEVLENDLEPGDIATVKVVSMSLDELEALPEFEGW